MVVSKTLLQLVALFFIGLGYLSYSFLPSFWMVTQTGHTDRVDLSLSQQVSSPTPLLLSEPTLPLEPTSTPTRLILIVATSTPTPHPTATARPTETPIPAPAVSTTPTNTPTSVPTLTPTAIDSPTPLPTLTPTIISTLESAVVAASQPGISHVIIITIDGLRPDALVEADAPHLDSLIAQGSYSPNAQTVKCSETLPGHAAMLSGMTPEKNGITFGLPYIGWPGMNGPTLFSVAHEAGLSTAMIIGKEKLSYIALPNSVDQLLGTDMHDPEVKDQAIKVIEGGLPAVLFIHFPDNDRVGHAYGWMSQNQLYAIAYVDGLIGEIVTELDRDGYRDNTLLIITADHGGHGSKHGDDSPLDRTVPWLAMGPGVPQGVILTRNINIYDTAATALYALHLPIPEIWDGQPIVEIFQ